MWSLTIKHIEIVGVFKTKVVCRIIGPVHERGSWRRGDNNEVKKLSVRRIIKSARLRWVGHVTMMSESEIPQKLDGWME